MPILLCYDRDSDYLVALVPDHKSVWHTSSLSTNLIIVKTVTAKQWWVTS